MAQIAPHDVPTLGKAESVSRRPPNGLFLARRFRGGQHGQHDRPRGRRLKGNRLRAFSAARKKLVGAVIERECEQYFDRFSAGELDPRDVRRVTDDYWGAVFLELILSARRDPRCTASSWARVTRFPMLGEVFWSVPDPSAETCPDRGFSCAVRRAVGALTLPDPRLAARAIRQPRARRCPAAPAAPPRSHARDREIEIVVEARSGHLYIRAFHTLV